MIIGAHESVAGGLPTVFERARIDGCRAVQIFTKNSNTWREPALDDKVIRAFHEGHHKLADLPILSHTSYLINLATDKPDVLAKSKDALVAEVERCSLLGVRYCVLHPGAHLGAGEDIGLTRTAECLTEVLERTRGKSCRILIENTAGQGTCVGHTFEHVAAIFEQTKDGERLGLCFDTQHAYASGYNIATKDGYEETFAKLDRLVGLSRLCAFHLNDSKKPLGSHVDRHEHAGEGELGLGLFWRLANDPRFLDTIAVLETEPRDEGTPHQQEVALINSLVGAAEPAPRVVPLTLEPVPAAPKKRKKS